MPFRSISGDPAKRDLVVPLSDLHPASLPPASFVTPNLCDDMHGVTQAIATQHVYTSCVADPDLDSRSDTWMGKRVPAWAATADVLIMFDEGSKATAPEPAARPAVTSTPS
jgi:hypothetical protein